MINAERPNFIDYAKTIGMFLVVLAHFPRHFVIPFAETPIWWAYHTIVLFHMPLFFIISGMLMKDVGFKVVVPRVLNRLIVPYISLCTISTIIGIIIYTLRGIPFNLALIKSQMMSIFMVSDHGYFDCFSSAMWFCIALAWIQIFFPISGNIMRFCLAMVGMILMHIGNVLPFKIDSALVGFVFFLIGYYAKHYFWALSDLSCLKSGIILLISLCVLCTTMFLNVNFGNIQCLSVNSMYYGVYPLLFIISGIAGSILIMIISMLLNKIRILKHFVTTVSAGTIVVLAFHKLVAISLGDFITIYTLSVGLLYSIACLCICYIFILIIRKYCPAIMGYR